MSLLRYTNDKNNTFLHIAVLKGKLEIVELYKTGLNKSILIKAYFSNFEELKVRVAKIIIPEIIVE